MKWPKPTGRIVIAGGSGFLGTQLARHLTALGCEVVILGRGASGSRESWRCVQWDARHVGAWSSELDGATAIVNLAGRSVDCKKTPENCDAILRSRVEATLALGAACREIEKVPPVWVQMSTAHIYGDPLETVCDESSAFGYGLAPTVGKAWEEAFAVARPDSTRGVVLRTSFVVGRDGGALERLGPLAKIGLGGTVGHGEQGMSWLHIRDMNRLFERGIADEAMSGVYIATAPNPVSNREFMAALRKAVGMPIGLPAFEWQIRLACKFVLRTDPELALCGRYCVPKRLMDEGHPFLFTDVEHALRDLYGR